MVTIKHLLSYYLRWYYSDYQCHFHFVIACCCSYASYAQFGRTLFKVRFNCTVISNTIGAIRLIQFAFCPKWNWSSTKRMLPINCVMWLRTRSHFQMNWNTWRMRWIPNATKKNYVKHAWLPKLLAAIITTVLGYWLHVWNE